MTQTPRQGCTVLPDIKPCPLPELGSTWLSLACPTTLRQATRKHAYKSPVCIAPEGGSVPAPRRSLTWASPLRVGRLSWGCGNLSVTTGVSMGMCCTTSACTVSLFQILFTPNVHQSLVCKKNIQQYIDFCWIFCVVHCFVIIHQDAVDRDRDSTYL